jgi:hypothetical protein
MAQTRDELLDDLHAATPGHAASGSSFFRLSRRELLGAPPAEVRPAPHDLGASPHGAPPSCRRSSRRRRRAA